MNKSDVILKLKALSERGVGGEKENATKLLEKMMKKYNISEEELVDEEKRGVIIDLNSKIEVKLCNQILWAYFDTYVYKIKNKRKKYYTELTSSQEIEFRYILSVYLENYHKEEEIFLYAYVQKNDIFPKNLKESDENEEITDEERKKRRKALLMQNGIEIANIRKALPS